MLTADGNILARFNRISLELSTKDRTLLELIRDELVPGGTYTTRTRSTGYQYDMLTFTSPHMVADLASYGVVPAKSLILRWPDKLDTGLARDFILGFFDGDGFITSQRTNGYFYNIWGICCGSEPFLVRMADIIEEQSSVRPGGPWLRTGSHAYTIRVTGKKALVIDAWLHAGGLGLARKRIAV